jgi:hypothetical protein
MFRLKLGDQVDLSWISFFFSPSQNIPKGSGSEGASFSIGGVVGGFSHFGIPFSAIIRNGSSILSTINCNIGNV